MPTVVICFFNRSRSKHWFDQLDQSWPTAAQQPEALSLNVMGNVIIALSASGRTSLSSSRARKKKKLVE